MKQRRGGKAPPKKTEEKLVTKTKSVSPSPTSSTEPKPQKPRGFRGKAKGEL